MMLQEDIQSIIQQARNQAIENLIKSIATHGLLPFAKIPEGILANDLVAGKASAEDDSVLALFHCTAPPSKQMRPDKMQLHLKSLTQAIYKQISTTLMHCAWRDPKITPHEAQQRLLQSIVFIFKPNEQQHEIINNIPMIRIREVPFNQSELRSCHQQLLAILIPEHLKHIIQQSFPQVDIISVECSNEPDKAYESALNTFVQRHYDKGYSAINFFFHVVRLHTEYDFKPRFIADSVASATLIQQTGGQLISQGAANEGWYLFHQRQITANLPELQKARGEYTMSLLVTKYVDSTVLAALETFGVHSVIKYNNQIMAGYLTTMKDDISKLVSALSSSPCKKIIEYFIQCSVMNKSLIGFLLQKTPKDLAIIEAYLKDSATNTKISINDVRLLKQYDDSPSARVAMQQAQKGYLQKAWTRFNHSLLDCSEFPAICQAYLKYCGYSLALKHHNAIDVTSSDIIWYCVYGALEKNGFLTCESSNALFDLRDKQALNVYCALIVDTFFDYYIKPSSILSSIRSSHLMAIVTIVTNLQYNALQFYSIFSQLCASRMTLEIINIVIDHAQAFTSDLERVIAGWPKWLRTADNLRKVLAHSNIKAVILAMEATPANHSVGDLYKDQQDLDRAFALLNESNIILSPDISSKVLMVEQKNEISSESLADNQQPLSEENKESKQEAAMISTPPLIYPVAQKEKKRPKMQRSGSISNNLRAADNAALQRSQSMFFSLSKKEKRRSMKMEKPAPITEAVYNGHHYVRAENTSQNFMLRLGFSQHTINHAKPADKEKLQIVYNIYKGTADSPSVVSKDANKGIVKLSKIERMVKYPGYEYKMKDPSSDYRILIRQEATEKNANGETFNYYVADKVITHKNKKVIYTVESPSLNVSRFCKK